MTPDQGTSRRNLLLAGGGLAALLPSGVAVAKLYDQWVQADRLSSNKRLVGELGLANPFSLRQVPLAHYRAADRPLAEGTMLVDKNGQAIKTSWVYPMRRVVVNTEWIPLDKVAFFVVPGSRTIAFNFDLSDPTLAMFLADIASQDSARSNDALKSLPEHCSRVTLGLILHEREAIDSLLKKLIK
ncbi:hypothetical protein A2631_01300 [Candidatus Daviesbacteria bacterium RIFCSPHIGHO2_01_FULL_44_29]|uniref:Uncharacterized protein n=1 Tax=Candidatus Daviesbacteria bacterium RIFCSPHIGHO2_02_FULL_43_12 TaxID=1797776 RepID=A0A1F5KKS6_9BACT|nr:MAG: hypothetical protein A2631_01300 [Candidatus Daviesbacteria bacterium RIFCSPHIGHO2_01_FULL_44_29]OGE41528.1 MAG: hypothetical protein A3D25_00720 [Candidatus Daviesbacteria bacterium RIFCSPHIGHO2_02_FULL_43_12]OGE69810.1 MAG: hypothetical protein A3B55_05365 [Candidatus Daviesbacteria bacterium RIFCSPLOWO2_01_FULL_43_15]